MNRLKKLIFASLFMVIGTLPFTMSLQASAQIPQQSKDSACAGIGAGSGNGCDGTAETTVGGIVSTVVEILSWIVGILAIIMVLYSGLNFITANGDSSKVSKARSSLIYALVGVAVAVSAQVLVNFVVGNVN